MLGDVIVTAPPNKAIFYSNVFYCKRIFLADLEIKMIAWCSNFINNAS